MALPTISLCRPLSHTSRQTPTYLPPRVHFADDDDDRGLGTKGSSQYSAGVGQYTLKSPLPESKEGVEYLKKHGAPPIEKLNEKFKEKDAAVLRYLAQHANWNEACGPADFDTGLFVSTNYLQFYYKKKTSERVEILASQRVAFAETVAEALSEIVPPLAYVALWLVHPEAHLRAAFILDIITSIDEGQEISSEFFTIL